jgi:nucleotide-binding universal stress UspA family protein
MTGLARMTEMTDQGAPGGFVIRRILAAFGAATMSPGALAGAVDLAGRLGAELETLFVEDVALLQWTELPFVRPLSLHGRGSTAVPRLELELQFRALAADAQARLTAFAAPQQLRWSFRTARGQILGEVAAAAARTDLLVLASSSRPIARAALLEPSLRSLIESVGAPVLLLRPEQPPRGPMHVVLEPGGETKKLLEAAAVMAGSPADRAIVTAWMPEGDRAVATPDDIVRRVPAIQVRSFPSPEGIEALIGAVAGGTLVLGAASRLIKLDSWWQHFARARCALLLVR